MDVRIQNNNIDHTFEDILKRILYTGYTYDDPYRSGVQRKEISQYTLKHNLLESFPAIQSKKLYFQTLQQELFWFLSGSTNLKDLWKRNVNIWDEDGYKFYVKRSTKVGVPILSKEGWKRTVLQEPNIDRVNQATADGNLGRIYPAQWRDFGGVDQISNLLHGMETRPMATDLIVSAWNPGEMKNMALPPCHYGFQMLGRPVTLLERVQYYKRTMEDKEKNFLSKHMKSEQGLESYLNDKHVPKIGFSLEWQQRSVDTFLGLPFNIASYGLLCEILCDIVGVIPLGIIGNLKKVHLYSNAIKEVVSMLSESADYSPAKLVKPKESFRYGYIDSVLEYIDKNELKYTLKNYNPGKARKVKMLSRDV